jgi:aminoglycoside phosphotransferase (APT) family kinase protein
VSVWQAERAVDERLVRELLGQFPELEVRSLRHLSEGWDRSVWLVDETIVFGFPRRAVVLEGLERELELLPRLAPFLPLPIPVPRHVGRPTRAFPWPFFGSAYLPGAEACDAGLDDAARTSAGIELAGFLRRLHGDGVAAALADSLPPDANRRADMAVRVPMARDALSELERLGLWEPPPGLARLLADAERLAPTTARTTVAHGDLHFRHLLVANGRASGVIDWIDLCRADPAIDLPLYWAFVSPSGRPAFLDAYGPVDEPGLLRSRVLAVFLAATLARYAHAGRHESLQREALASLTRTLSG